LAPDSRHAIVFAGFQAAGTRGEALVHGKTEIKIHGEMWPVRAEVFNLEGLSAHADADEIMKWAGALSPKPSRVFVTHGEPSASRELAERLRAQLGLDASVPEMMSEISI
jgi:metallo-beta-lactamase family protein